MPAAEASISLLPDGTFTMRPGCITGWRTYAIDGNRLMAGGPAERASRR